MMTISSNILYFDLIIDHVAMIRHCHKSNISGSADHLLSVLENSSTFKIKICSLSQVKTTQTINYVHRPVNELIFLAIGSVGRKE